MLTMRKITTTALVAGGLLLAGWRPVTAQSANAVGVGNGCPWCTTPTTCGSVDENSPYDQCFYTQANGCFYPSDPRECTFGGGQLAGVEVSEASTTLYRLLKTANMGENDIIEMDTERWGPQHLVALSDGLYAYWSCTGDLLGLVRMSQEGEQEYLDPAPFQHVFSVGGLLSREVTRQSSEVVEVAVNFGKPDFR